MPGYSPPERRVQHHWYTFPPLLLTNPLHLLFFWFKHFLRILVASRSWTSTFLKLWAMLRQNVWVVGFFFLKWHSKFPPTWTSSRMDYPFIICAKRISPPPSELLSPHISGELVLRLIIMRDRKTSLRKDFAAYLKSVQILALSKYVSVLFKILRNLRMRSSSWKMAGWPLETINISKIERSCSGGI